MKPQPGMYIFQDVGARNLLVPDLDEPVTIKGFALVTINPDAETWPEKLEACVRRLDDGFETTTPMPIPPGRIHTWPLFMSFSLLPAGRERQFLISLRDPASGDEPETRRISVAKGPDERAPSP
jgi:hypothetical protein